MKESKDLVHSDKCSLEYYTGYSLREKFNSCKNLINKEIYYCVILLNEVAQQVTKKYLRDIHESAKYNESLCSGVGPLVNAVRAAVALGYFINPFDVIPDFVIGSGFLDDLGCFSITLRNISIPKDILIKAKIKMKKFLNEPDIDKFQKIYAE